MKFNSLDVTCVAGRFCFWFMVQLGQSDDINQMFQHGDQWCYVNNISEIPIFFEHP